MEVKKPRVICGRAASDSLCGPTSTIIVLFSSDIYGPRQNSVNYYFIIIYHYLVFMVPVKTLSIIRQLPVGQNTAGPT